MQSYFLALLCILGVTFSAEAQNTNLDLPSYKLIPLKDSKPLDLKNSNSKVILLDLWASWCEPCKASLPYYSSLQKKFGEKIQFIGVSVDDDGADALKFLNENNFDFQAYHDKSKLLVKAAKVEAIPMFFMLSPKGEVLATFRGSKPRYKKEIEEKLTQLLR